MRPLNNGGGRQQRRIVVVGRRTEMMAHHGAGMVQGQVVMVAGIVVVWMVMEEGVSQGRAARSGRAVASLGMKDKVLAQMAHALPGVAGRQASMQHIGEPSSCTLCWVNSADDSLAVSASTG
jgi:hypothetical protein